MDSFDIITGATLVVVVVFVSIFQLLLPWLHFRKVERQNQLKFEKILKKLETRDPNQVREASKEAIDLISKGPYGC